MGVVSFLASRLALSDERKSVSFELCRLSELAPSAFLGADGE